jgi:hypothetical protein
MTLVDDDKNEEELLVKYVPIQVPADFTIDQVSSHMKQELLEALNLGMKDDRYVDLAEESMNDVKAKKQDYYKKLGMRPFYW